MTVPELLKKHSGKLVIALLFFASVLAAYMVRTYHFNKEMAGISKASGAEFVPFTIESAIMYSYTKDAGLGQGIPDTDPTLRGMEKYKVNEQFTISMEYFLGWGYKIKKFIFGAPELTKKNTRYEDSRDFSDWVRFQIRLWLSLTAGLIFLWLIIMRCPWYLAFGGALLYAISPAAIARYTGQELVRGNFALPLLVASFVMAYWAFRRSSPLKLAGLGVLVFLAFASWDMCQIVFALWGLSEIFRLLAGAQVNTKRRNVWLVVYIAVALAGIIVPYHRTHSLLISPLALIILPTILAAYFLGKDWWKKRYAVTLGACLILIGIWKLSLSFGGFGGSYGHFGELMKAKLAFGNVKPLDPNLLNFDARILWTPEMHSATWRIAKDYFPSILCVFFLFLIPIVPFSSYKSPVFEKLISNSEDEKKKNKLKVISYVLAGISIFFCSYVFLLLADKLLIWPEHFCEWLEAVTVNKEAKSTISFMLLLGRCIFVLALILLPFAFTMRVKKSVRKNLGRSYFPVFMAVFYCLAFIFVVRYYVLAILFISIALPMLLQDWFKALKPSVPLKDIIKKADLKQRLTFAPAVLITLLLSLVMFFALFMSPNMTRNYDMWGFKELSGLISWMRYGQLNNGRTVLAGLRISPMIKAYTGSGILIQPKFEIGRTRELVEEYLNLLYHGDEISFNKFCVDNGIDYFVYDIGDNDSPVKVLHPYSNRYVANAFNVSPKAPASFFFKNPRKCKWFYELEPPAKVSFINKRYRLFKVISPLARRKSMEWVLMGNMALKNRDMVNARKFAKAAFYADPISEDAYELYYNAFRKIPRINLKKDTLVIKNKE